MCIGDGAVAILLADAETASKHRLDRLAHLSGWGISNDANHITGPARDGAGLIMAMETAMGMAGLPPDDTQAFCAHGTGTVFNDSTELAAIEAVFGDRRFPVFSIKGAVGHTLGAAGAIDAERTRSIGIIASTRYGCFETDLAFYATTRDEEGIYASPSLFAFTLPGIAISEAAIHFRLTGPTFTVGDPVGPRGHNALCIAVDLLASGTCHTVFTGWLDAGNRLLKQKAADDDGVRGAIFIALSTGHEKNRIQHIRQKDSALYAESGMKICTIMDLVNGWPVLQGRSASIGFPNASFANERFRGRNVLSSISFRTTC